MRPVTLYTAGLATVSLVLGAGVFVIHQVSSARKEAEVLAAGQAIYGEHCSACHGASLQGQPDWQTPHFSGRLPAPPHDAGGHTWHHPDAVLFRLVKEGVSAVVGGNYESDMPGFAGVLSDDEIRAVLAYIKSTWPERERSHQAQVSTADASG